MAKVTTSKVIAELSQDEVRPIRFSLDECLRRWDIDGNEDRRTAAELLDDLGGAPV